MPPTGAAAFMGSVRDERVFSGKRGNVRNLNEPAAVNRRFSGTHPPQAQFGTHTNLP